MEDSTSNGWRTVSKIGGGLLIILALASACWTGVYVVGTTVGGVASQNYVQAQVAPIDSAVHELDTQMDSVSDSVQGVEGRADSLRRDLRALMWMVCRSDATPTHRRCEDQ